MSWRSQREGLIARPMQRDTLWVQSPWYSHPGTTQKGRGIGRGLRQSVRRLAAGQGVLTAMTSCPGTVKARWGADLRQFQEARLCAAPGRSQRRAGLQQGIRHRTSLGHASGMTAASTVSRCCGLLKSCTRNWRNRVEGLTQKRSPMGQRDHYLKRNRVALTKGEIDGCRRCV